MKITLDFTKTATTVDQEVAVMPANLAKRMLEFFANQLVDVPAYDIIDRHIQDLHQCTTVNEAVELSISWIQERELIRNIQDKNWKAYEVKEPKAKRSNGVIYEFDEET